MKIKKTLIIDKNHFGYKQLSIPEGVEAQPLAVPPVLKPDKETDTDVWFTLESKEGESQILPGEKTKTWCYNAPLLGKKMVVEKGKRVHVTLKNSLPEITTYHWHGMEVPGPITDGVVMLQFILVKKSKSNFQLFYKIVLFMSIINWIIGLIIIKWEFSVTLQ